MGYRGRNRQKTPPRVINLFMWKDYTIAIIEDSQALSHALADKFHRVNFKVLLANDGKTGLEEVLKQQPDLILVDIMMPIMNGIEFLEMLRKNQWGEKVPVIIVSNSDREDHRKEAEKYNCIDYIIKANTTMENLINLVKTTLIDKYNHSKQNS